MPPADRETVCPDEQDEQGCRDEPPVVLKLVVVYVVVGVRGV